MVEGNGYARPWEQSLEVIKESTAAVTASTAAVGVLATSVANLTREGLDTNKMLLGQAAVLKETHDGILAIPQIAKDNREEIIEKVTDKISQKFFWMATAIVLSNLFGGLGTRLLEVLRLVGVH